MTDDAESPKSDRKHLEDAYARDVAAYTAAKAARPSTNVEPPSEKTNASKGALAATSTNVEPPIAQQAEPRATVSNNPPPKPPPPAVEPPAPPAAPTVTQPRPAAHVIQRAIDQRKRAEWQRRIEWQKRAEWVGEKQGTGFVYFIGEKQGPVKIGVSVNPQARLQDLQIGHPGTLEILTQFPGDKKLETALHKLLAADRLNGEWFRRSPMLLAFLQKGRAATMLVDVVRKLSR